MAAKTKSPFGPGLLKFLRELEKNNERPWFEENKQRYEDQVREPALAFIRAMAPHVRKVSRHLMAEDRKVGGSLMRIHRDVRFSKDKQPYKTNVGIQFRHEDGKDVHAPGLYVHLADDGIFLAAGMWHPDKEPLAAVRAAIDTDPTGWKRARDGKRFREHWELQGDSLKRAPKGYDPEHPMIEDLRRKDHIAVCSLQKGDVSKPGFVELVAERFARTKGYLGWMTKATGVPF